MTLLWNLKEYFTYRSSFPTRLCRRKFYWLQISDNMKIWRILLTLQMLGNHILNHQLQQKNSSYSCKQSWPKYPAKRRCTNFLRLDPQMVAQSWRSDWLIRSLTQSTNDSSGGLITGWHYWEVVVTFRVETHLGKGRLLGAHSWNIFSWACVHPTLPSSWHEIKRFRWAWYTASLQTWKHWAKDAWTEAMSQSKSISF